MVGGRQGASSVPMVSVRSVTVPPSNGVPSKTRAVVLST